MAKAQKKKVATKKAATKAAAKSGSKAKASAKAKAPAKKTAKAKASGKSTQKTAKKVTAKAAAKPTAKTAAKKSAAPKAKAAKAPMKGKTPAPKMTGAAQKKSAGTISNLFTPLDDRIVIQRAGTSDRTPGGLYIPETVADRPNQGKVIAVGRGHRDKKGRVRPLDVQLGDTVMFSSFAGSEMNLNGVDVLVLREDEVLAIVKSEVP